MKKGEFAGYDFSKPALVRLWELHELERISLLYGASTAELLRPAFRNTGDRLIEIWSKIN